MEALGENQETITRVRSHSDMRVLQANADGLHLEADPLQLLVVDNKTAVKQVGRSLHHVVQFLIVQGLQRRKAVRNEPINY